MTAAKFSLSFVIVAISSAITAAPPPNGPHCNFGTPSAKEASTAISDLAMKLYQKIATPDNNVIFSPVSIALALALVESGAEGKTKTEIQRLIGDRNSSGSYEALQRQLQLRGEQSRLSVANGFFYSDALRLKRQYVEKVQRCFETRVTQEPFVTKPEDARARINRWVADATADKIPELLKPGTVDAGTVAVLANAIYMKAAWANKFEKFENLPFYRFGKTDQVQTVRFMTREGEYNYASTNAHAVVELPYTAEAPLSLFIILPTERNGLQASEQALTGAQLLSLFSQVQNREVSLKLPKFTIRQSVQLTSVLKQLGVGEMFSDQADFSRMSADPLAVSDAVHEAYIKVNENGTEAAAATALAFMALSMPLAPPQPIQFVADHPFIFAVVHRPTSAVSFMGRVSSVSEEE